MTVTMDKIGSVVNQFSVSPSIISFASSGGRQSVFVTCPNGSWTIYDKDSRYSAQRLEDIAITGGVRTEITINVYAGNEDINFEPMVIRWNNPSTNAWEYREVQISQSAPGSVVGNVTFRGQVIDGGTGSGLAGAIISLDRVFWGPTPSPNYNIGTATTDSMGNWSIIMPTSDGEWMGPRNDELPIYSSLSAVTVTATKDGYLPDEAEINTSDLPVFSSAVQNGVTFENLTIVPENVNSGVVILRAHYNLFYVPNLVGKTVMFQFQISGQPNPDAWTPLRTAIIDANGDAIVTPTFEAASWDIFTAIRVVLNMTPGDENLYVDNPAVIRDGNLPSFANAIQNGIYLEPMVNRTNLIQFSGRITSGGNPVAGLTTDLQVSYQFGDYTSVPGQVKTPVISSANGLYVFWVPIDSNKWTEDYQYKVVLSAPSIGQRETLPRTPSQNYQIILRDGYVFPPIEL
jgi:hypothetical protein